MLRTESNTVDTIAAVAGGVSRSLCRACQASGASGGWGGGTAALVELLAGLLSCFTESGQGTRNRAELFSTNKSFFSIIYLFIPFYTSQLGGFPERCDVRFNCACALTLAGQEAEASALLGQLVACGGITSADLMADEDLGSVRDRPWFQELLGPDVAKRN